MTDSDYLGIFMNRLVRLEDDAETPTEYFDNCLATVEWRAEHDADQNVVPASEAPAFIQWIEANQTLIEVTVAAWLKRPMSDVNYLGIFLRDLARHDDISATAGECIDQCIANVRWHADNEPDANVVDADEVETFIQWIHDNREGLLANLCMDYNDIGPTVEAAVALGKSQILADIASGTVPSSIDNFGDLHDYVDANMYGGLGECEYEWETEDGFCDYGNALQDALNAWLQERAGILDSAGGYDRDHGVYWRVMLVKHAEHEGLGRFQVLVKLQWPAGDPLVFAGVGSSAREALGSILDMLHGYKRGVRSLFPKGHNHINLIEDTAETAVRSMVARQICQSAA